MDKEKKEYGQPFLTSDVVTSIPCNTAKEILQELYERAMRNDYSVVYLEDIIELANKNDIKVN